MPDPISTDDLYGPSSPPVPEGQPTAVTPSIPIEETPEITVEESPLPTSAPAPVSTPAPIPVTPPPPKPQPVPEVHGPMVQKSDQPPAKKTSFISTLGAFLLFVGLFVVGILLSSVIRQYFPGGTSQQEVVIAPSPTPTPTDPFATWKTYQVISGTTKLPIEGLSYKLPPDILASICDTTSCISQGTYLPGGTRLTLAPRGVGQLLVDFRGSAITDVSGTAFTTESSTVNGHAAKLFTGSFAGRTVAGYGFSQMRGYMIEVTPSLSLEINHFTPTGVTADFATDDTLFDQIVSSLSTSATSSAAPIITPTTIIIPVITTTPVPATNSGY